MWNEAKQDWFGDNKDSLIEDYNYSIPAIDTQVDADDCELNKDFMDFVEEQWQEACNVYESDQEARNNFFNN